jgi:hypothetical protein
VTLFAGEPAARHVGGRWYMADPYSKRIIWRTRLPAKAARTPLANAGRRTRKCRQIRYSCLRARADRLRVDSGQLRRVQSHRLRPEPTACNMLHATCKTTLPSAFAGRLQGAT